MNTVISKEGVLWMTSPYFQNGGMMGYKYNYTPGQTSDDASLILKINNGLPSDIDAYGSPYEILSCIINRIDKKHDKYGFVITDGVSMDLRLGRICAGIRALTGINHHIVKNASFMHDELIGDIIKSVCKEIGGVVTHFKIAKGKTGAAMRYYAFVFFFFYGCSRDYVIDLV